MYIVGAEVHEEGILLVGFDEVNGVGGYRVGYVLIFPEGFASAFHVAYAADAVDYGHVMAVR